jgi:hypothetical protein
LWNEERRTKNEERNGERQNAERGWVPSFAVPSFAVPPFAVPPFGVPPFRVQVFRVPSFCVAFFVLSSSFFVLHGSQSPGTLETLRSIGGLPVSICNVFREPQGFQQAANGVYYVFDRRGHAVYSIDPTASASRKVVEIGGEGGRLLAPSAFDLSPDGRFVVADSPNGRERIQVFDYAGTWLTGFTLPGKATTRISIGPLALGGVGSLAFLGDGLALNQPETGALVTEYGLSGTPVRSIGALRATGYEADRQVHLAMNTGIPLPVPGGGYYFVFYAGTPIFRRYDAKGTLVFERRMQGRELDPLVQQAPKTWPRRSVDGTELPLVVPTVRTAAVDRSGNLWVSFVVPVTYVFDATGEKTRTVQFRAAGTITPGSLFFTARDRILVTPGCYEFEAR